MNRSDLFHLIQKKRSFLCIGLDTDLKKIPLHLMDDKDPVFKFNKQIIDATHEQTIAYKPNLAFYESEGSKGWKSLEKTIDYLKKHEVFTIADAKRGDIGNTSSLYARAFFETMHFDAVTVAPYMGSDSVSPFLGYKDKWVVLLALTSNKGAIDFQFISNKNTHKKLFEDVLEKSSQWGSADNMMYVVGATQADMLRDVRKLVPDHFLLVPGEGAQGGSLQEVAKHGLNAQCGLIVNSSRGIIYASSDKNFAQAAKKNALEVQGEMEIILKKNNLI